MSVVPQDPASGYAKELPAGLIPCPKCKQDTEMVATVLGRRQFSTPIIEQKRHGVCLHCDIEIEDRLESGDE